MQTGGLLGYAQGLLFAESSRFGMRSVCMLHVHDLHSTVTHQHVAAKGNYPRLLGAESA